jgi:hypothetical protein
MSSKPTPYTHTGVTTEELMLKVGPSSYEVKVPAGTQCIRLDEGFDPWVVSDLRFIQDKGGILYLDADIYGIHVPESKVTAIQPV